MQNIHEHLNGILYTNIYNARFTDYLKKKKINLQF